MMIKRKVEDRIRELQEAYGRYSRSPERHAFELAATVERVARLLPRIDDAQRRKKLERWVRTERQRSAEYVSALRGRFSAELDRRLHDAGLDVSGRYPRLRVPPFVLELDFRGGKARILYGPEVLKRSIKLDPERLCEAILDARAELEGGPFDAARFLRVLEEAHLRVRDTGSSPRARIVDVFEQLKVSRQGKTRDALGERFTRYTRAQFAYDLHRLIRSGIPLRGLRLLVATLDQTRRRSDFLWVQTRSTGEGTAFSYIEFGGKG